MLTLNESKVCDAIVRHLEAAAAAARADVKTHDRHPDPAKRVELTFRLGAELVAVEHTGIEPFDGFMRMNAEAAKHFEPIKEAAKHAVPPGTVAELHVPVKALQGLPPKKVYIIQSALAKFIVDAAPKLRARRYHDYIGDIGPSAVPDVPFPVRLYLFESMGIMPPVQIVHTATSIEEARADRLRQACEKKFPKLQRWKVDDNARTILVLEDNDIQLTNAPNVADAFLPIARSRGDAPDETYMIFTAAEPWYLWPILVNGASYFELAGRSHPIHSEIDPNGLSAVTER